MGGIANGDQVFYFLAAQDNTNGAIPQSNPAGVLAADVNNMGTPPSSLNSYLISAAMPVKLLSFSVKKTTPSSALLSWAADPSEQAQDYEVWKSNDGVQYHRIAIVPVNTEAKYNYSDDQLSIGTAHYRLKMLELSGAVTFSKILTVQNAVDGAEVVSIRRATTKGSSSLEAEFYSPTKSSVQITITDVSGRKLVQQNYKVSIGNTNISIPIHVLQTGTYYLQAVLSGKMPLKAVPFTKY